MSTVGQVDRAAFLTSRRHVDLCRVTGALCRAETPIGRSTTTGEASAGAVVPPPPRTHRHRDRR
ncbi:putative leader peptide [Sphaerisporangium sp. NPDC049002]|uniref:putative leader peptide n=1 Tax=unclassified Sphaerisporangium TaxID=2630420 RepID=UPI00340D11F7